MSSDLPNKWKILALECERLKRELKRERAGWNQATEAIQAARFAHGKTLERLEKYQDAIRKATSIDMGGHAEQNSLGDHSISTAGHALLKKTLEDT